MGLDGVELMMAIERHFQIDIPDSEVTRMETVGDIHLWLCRELRSRPPTLDGRSARSWSDDEIWADLRDLVRYQLDVPLAAVQPEAHIVYDLGAD